MEENIQITFPNEEDFDKFQINVTKIIVDSSISDDVRAIEDPEYEQFLADVWVGVVLTLMVVSCVCFMCSCLIYHKFQQWKTRVIETRNATNLEAGTNESELPSYTIASGLPTYEEALEQLKKFKELNTSVTSVKYGNEVWIPKTPPTPETSRQLPNLFHIYKNTERGSIVKRI